MQEFCVIYANALFFNFYDNPFHVGTENPLFHVGHSGQHGIEADMGCNTYIRARARSMDMKRCAYVMPLGKSLNLLIKARFKLRNIHRH